MSSLLSHRVTKFLKTPCCDCTYCTSRIGRVQMVMAAVKNIRCNLGKVAITLSTKIIRLLKTLACPVMTYGCEMWTTRKEDETGI